MEIFFPLEKFRNTRILSWYAFASFILGGGAKNPL